MNKVPITIEGAEKLREELKQLKTVDRPRITQAIAEARAHGDLKENAEYHAAKEEQGLSEAAARLIVSRNLKPVEGGYTWTTDPRLRGASAIKMTEEQVRSVLHSLNMPTLLLMAEHGLASAKGSRFASMGEHIPGVIQETLPGGHHFHMEGSVATLGDRINQFLGSEV